MKRKKEKRKNEKKWAVFIPPKKRSTPANDNLNPDCELV
jgi:hypothetical protein